MGCFAWCCSAAHHAACCATTKNEEKCFAAMLSCSIAPVDANMHHAMALHWEKDNFKPRGSGRVGCCVGVVRIVVVLVLVASGSIVVDYGMGKMKDT